MRRLVTVVFGVVTALTGLALVALLIVAAPRTLVEWDVGPAGLQQMEPTERAAAENEARTTLLQALGGAILLAGAFLTWTQLQTNRDQIRREQERFEETSSRNQEQFQNTFNHSQAQLALSHQQAREAHEASQRELALNREALFVDRLARAGEQIASHDTTVRVVGIHGLERIAELSQQDQHAVARILAAFINDHAPWTSDDQAMLDQAIADECTWTKPWPDSPSRGRRPVPPWLADLPRLHRRAFDVHTALQVLRQLDPAERGHLILADVDLRRLRLADDKDINLHGIDFPGAHFEGSYLVRVDFSRSRLNGAHFEGASLFECSFPMEMGEIHFDGAEFLNCSFPLNAMLEQATLRRATFRGTELTGVQLWNADLRDAKIGRCGLQGATLRRANLAGADLGLGRLEQADLQEANLHRANLRGANFEAAQLDGATLGGAIADCETTWPTPDFDHGEAGIDMQPGTTLDALDEKTGSP